MGLTAIPSSTFGVPVAPSRSVLRPLGIRQVTINDGFWADKQRTNHASSIPHCLRWDTKLGWINNFALKQAGADQDSRAGREFSDSEVYKLVEAMVWESSRTHDEGIENEVRALSALIASAQDDDGYLNTHFGQEGQEARYSDFEWGHELYCYGHLFQAAAARLRNGYNDDLVNTALHVADHVLALFGVGGAEVICGHPEIEVGLAELGRATGRSDLIEMARIFVERRGRGLLKTIEWGQEYFQDDMPVREATVFRGHAVRAGYLAAGTIDVAVETGDSELLSAIQTQYDRTLACRTYITGGVGSRHTGEAFGEDFELPPDRAYCETCAAISSVMVAWRLLLATGEERYADAIERCLYNAIACSPSQSGDSFFYANPLHVRKPGSEPDQEEPCPRAESGRRAPWFSVSCCLPNVARLFASLSGYIATVEGNRLRIHQFASGEVSATLANGARVRLAIRTDYPYDGRITVKVLECEPGEEWSVALRIPRWAKVRLTGLEQDGNLAVATGRFTVGTTFIMEIDMSPRVVFPDPRIDAVRGCVAVERGPLVLCLESSDLSMDSVDGFEMDATVPPIADGDGAQVSGYLREYPLVEWPYSTDSDTETREAVRARLIPYHRWGNNGPTAMRVWIPRATT